MNKKEKKTNKLVEVHLLGCLLHTDAPKPNRRLRREHGGGKNIITTLCQGWLAELRLDPCLLQETKRDKSEELQPIQDDIKRML
jgi:hypothetical protein